MAHGDATSLGCRVHQFRPSGKPRLKDRGSIDLQVIFVLITSILVDVVQSLQHNRISLARILLTCMFLAHFCKVMVFSMTRSILSHEAVILVAPRPGLFGCGCIVRFLKHFETLSLR